MLTSLEARALKDRIIELLTSADIDQEKTHFAVGITLPDDEKDLAGFKVAVRVANEGERDIAAAKIDAAGFSEQLIDLDIIGEVRDLPPPPRQPENRPKLAIGMSISHVDGGTGTLGFFAERRNGERGFVSCNHVIAGADRFALETPILAPAKEDGGLPDRDVAGHLTKVASFTAHKFKYADAAFARAVPERMPDNPGFLHEKDGKLIKPLGPIRRGIEVLKVGRTTERSKGRIRACWLDWFRIDFGGPSIRLHDVIEIVATEKDQDGDFITFCDGGDSGALVYAPAGNGLNRPVGLLFAKSAVGGPGSSGVAYANPVGKVMRALGVEMIV